jgi:hypothetical protein
MCTIVHPVLVSAIMAMPMLQSPTNCTEGVKNGNHSKSCSSRYANKDFRKNDVHLLKYMSMCFPFLKLFYSSRCEHM